VGASPGAGGLRSSLSVFWVCFSMSAMTSRTELRSLPPRFTSWKSRGVTFSVAAAMPRAMSSMKVKSRVTEPSPWSGTGRPESAASTNFPTDMSGLPRGP
jgi:hypothetical protein